MSHEKRPLELGDVKIQEPMTSDGLARLENFTVETFPVRTLVQGGKVRDTGLKNAEMTGLQGGMLALEFTQASRSKDPLRWTLLVMDA